MTLTLAVDLSKLTRPALAQLHDATDDPEARDRIYQRILATAPKPSPLKPISFAGPTSQLPQRTRP